MADTARAVELRLVTALPAALDGTRLWMFEVLYTGLGGPYTDVYVIMLLVKALGVDIPSAALRAQTYREFANSLPGAVNTVPNTVVASDHVEFGRRQ